jgi:hypothetical protein
MVNVRAHDPYSSHVQPADVEPEREQVTDIPEPQKAAAPEPAPESPARAARRASRKRRGKPAPAPPAEDLSSALAELDAEEKSE